MKGKMKSLYQKNIQHYERSKTHETQFIFSRNGKEPKEYEIRIKRKQIKDETYTIEK